MKTLNELIEILKRIQPTAGTVRVEVRNEAGDWCDCGGVSVLAKRDGTSVIQIGVDEEDENPD